MGWPPYRRMARRRRKGMRRPKTSCTSSSQLSCTSAPSTSPPPVHPAKEHLFEHCLPTPCPSSEPRSGVRKPPPAVDPTPSWRPATPSVRARFRWSHGDRWPGPELLAAAGRSLSVNRRGHYLAYVLVHTQWFKCDDACISRVTPEEVLAAKACVLCPSVLPTSSSFASRTHWLLRLSSLPLCPKADDCWLFAYRYLLFYNK